MQSSSDNKSEVARIRQQIELESMSMVHALLFATAASHTIINHKFETLDTLTSQLAEHMPREQAIKTMIETYDAAIEDARHGTDDLKRVLWGDV